METQPSWLKTTQPSQTKEPVNGMLGIKNIRVERSHRVKRRKGDKSQKTRAKLCNLLSFKEKILVMKNANKLKGTNIFIDEDYSLQTMEYRKKLWDKVK